MLKRLTRFTGLLSLGLFLEATGWAQSNTCWNKPAREAKQQVEELTGNLKVASYRGDIKKMTSLASELESYLDSCVNRPRPPANEFSCMPQADAATSAKPLSTEDEFKLGSVCDSECHAELARYHLFMSGDFLYLATKSDANAQSQIKLQNLAKSHADLCGLPIIERGLKVLSRQNNVDLEANPDEADVQRESPFELWVRNNFKLQKLKIRLLMASGDLSYQATSDLALKNMMNGIEDAVSLKKSSDNTLKMAHARYRAALWTGIELKTDIPNMTRFDDLKLVVDELHFQTKRRLNSIEKGHLYLDIDPDTFTTFRSDELVAKLRALEGKIKSVELAINELFKAGQDDIKRQEDEGIDEKRTINTMAVNVKATKIAQLQDLAEKNRLELEGRLMGLEKQSLGIQGDLFNNQLTQQQLDANIKQLDEVVAGIETRLSALDEEKAQTSIDIAKARENIVSLEKNEAKLRLDSETLAYRKEMRRLEFDLRRAMENAEFERRQIKGMEERDLIALNRNRIKEEQAKYQWLINYEVTTLNLSLQIKSLGAQIVSHMGSIESALSESKSLQAQGQGLYSEFRGLDAELQGLTAGMKSAFFRKHSQTLFARMETRSKICQAERQLAFLGVKAGQHGFAPFGANNGGITLEQLTGTGSTGNGAKPQLVATQEPFSYELFTRESYPKTCEQKHSQLFKEAGITWRTDDEDGIFHLEEAQFPLLANYSRLTSNPLEDLSQQTVEQTGEQIDIKLADLLEDSNQDCGYAPRNMNTLAYHEAMCGNSSGKKGLRDEISAAKISHAEFLVRCVQAETADSDPICKQFSQSLIELTQQLAAKNSEYVAEQVTTLENSIKRLEKFADDLKVQYRFVNNAIVLAQAAVSTAGMIYSATASLPKTTFESGTSGMGPHFVTTMSIDPGPPALGVFSTIQTIQELIVSGIKNEQELWEKVRQLENQIAQLRGSISELKKQEAKDKVSTALTLAELRGNRIGTEHELADLRLQNQVIITDCKRGFAEWEDQVQVAVSEHKRLLTELKQQNAAARSIDFEIERMRYQAEETLAKQDQIRARLDGLNISMRRLRKDAERSQWQIENTVQQMCMIDESRGIIVDHNSVLGTTIELALKMIDDAAEKNIISLNSDQRERVEKSLKTSETETAELLALQEKSIDLANASYSNSLGILKSQSEIAALETMRAELENKAAQLGSDRAEQKARIAAILSRINALTQEATKLSVNDLQLKQEQIEVKQNANSAQKAVHQDIQGLRDEILKDVTTVLLETENKKKGFLLETQRAIESVAMGIPEYIEVKNRLVQEANLKLNLLRSRLNLAAGLNSDQPLLTSGAYIRSSYELDKTLDSMVASVEDRDITLIKAPTTTIVVKQGSGFYQELLKNSRARFEIAPLPGTGEDEVQAEMEQKGFYTLWSHNFHYPNLRLVDMMLSLPASCSDANTNFVHIQNLGGGYVFMPTDHTGSDYEPVLVASKRRTAHSLPLRSEKDSSWSSFLDKWKVFLSGDVKLREIDERIDELNHEGSNSVSGVLVGLPVKGIYEISLDANSKCREALQNSDLKIHFNMSRDRVSGFDPS